MVEEITSVSNPKIKNIVKLQKSSERKAQNLVVIEGVKEVGLAIDSGMHIVSLFICKEFCKQEVIAELKKKCEEAQLFFISNPVFEKVAYRENRDGVIALATPINTTLAALKLSSNPFIIILESVEKPGNLGAILRTADAAKVDAVIVCDPTTDIYNPNVIRSSIGCLFSTQVAVDTTENVLQWLKENKITSYAAALTATELYYTTNFTTPSAIIMGTEATGLSNTWLQKADKQIKIPMAGKIDSLNVSTSCAILTFEVVRQRLKKL